MSMNKYMHPRNIYKNPPNFKQLAINYPEFRRHVTQDISGKIILDFKDVKALRALSQVLLLKDFDLIVEIPENKLVPTVPLRLNYLLWIEDLLSIRKLEHTDIWGIDIGTGASCVYPLIAAKKFNWNMIGTDIDEESLECAKRNVLKNKLNDLIEICKGTEDTLLTNLINSSKRNFDFCMCNPPFFSSTKELHPFFKSRKSNRPHPKNAFCATTNEVVVNGGEIEFITKLISESIDLKDRVQIFTTMVGHKSSLAQLKSKLREIEVCSFKQTEFCQGRTTRWGLAWTFLDIDLRQIPEVMKKTKKTKPPLTYILENKTMEQVSTSLQALFSDLNFTLNEQKKLKNGVMFDLTAYSNTWSNQRRKRREKLKQKEETNSSSTSENSEDLNNASKKLADMDIAATTPKREHEDDDEYYNCKKIKTDNNNYLAKFYINLVKQNSQLVLELFSTDSDTNRESLHQIMQYLKNNFK